MTAVTTRLTQPPLQPILLWPLTQTPLQLFRCLRFDCISLAPARLDAHPRGCTGHVADPISSIETLPALARCFPRSFTFYVADPSAPFADLVLVPDGAS